MSVTHTPCPQCQAPNHPTARWCVKCAHPLEAEAPPPPRRRWNLCSMTTSTPPAPRRAGDPPWPMQAPPWPCWPWRAPQPGTCWAGPMLRRPPSRPRVSLPHRPRPAPRALPSPRPRAPSRWKKSSNPNAHARRPLHLHQTAPLPPPTRSRSGSLCTAVHPRHRAPRGRCGIVARHRQAPHGGTSRRRTLAAPRSTRAVAGRQPGPPARRAGAVRRHEQ